MNKNLKFVLYNCIYKYALSWTILSITAMYWALSSKITPDFVGKLTEALVNKSDNVIYLVGYFFAIKVLYIILTRLYDYVWLKLRIKLKKTIMEEIFFFILHNKIKDFNTASNLLRNIADELPFCLNLIFNNMAAYIVLFAFASSNFYMLDADIFYAFMLLLFFFTIGTIIVIKKGFVLSDITIAKHNGLLNYMLNVRDNFFYIQFYKNFAKENKSFQTDADKYYKSLYERDYLYFILHLAETLVCFAYEFFCLYISINKFYKGEIQIGALTTFLMFNKDIIRYIWDASYDITKIIKYSQTVYTSLNVILSQDNQILIDSCKVQGYEINFKNVDFDYDVIENETAKKINVIKNFNLTIKENEKIIILGESGKGKSTIVNLLIDKYLISKGEIFIDDKNIDKLDLSNYISIINQDLSLFNRSFYENIGYANLNATKEEIEEAAKSVNIHEVIIEKGGYEVIIDDKSNSLSYGQRQRILIARAIISKAPILILDEPTSALDEVNENLINNILLSIKNKTIILISHKKDILKAKEFREVVL